jgi:hypothetical protein
MQFLAIVLLCMLFAVAYGILHDQITARVCVEYFTIGHPPAFDTEDPTLLGLGWGIIATWWVGAIMGVPLGLAARIGCRNQRTAISLIRPLAILMGMAGVCALVAGIVGYLLASTGVVFLLEPLASQIPKNKHVHFLADLWAHNASYAVGFFGGLVVIGQTAWSRFRPKPSAPSKLGR